MAITIPTTIINDFNAGIDSLLNSPIAKQCTVYYTPHREKCNNCVSFNLAGGGSLTSKYLSGGPNPFPDSSLCPLCGGNGYRMIQASDNITCLLFFTPKDFQVFGTINIPDGAAMIEGYSTDLPKLLKMDYIVLNSAEVMNFKYRLHGKYIPKGFGMNRYFIQLLERIN